MMKRKKSKKKKDASSDQKKEQFETEETVEKPTDDVINQVNTEQPIITITDIKLADEKIEEQD